MVTVDGLMPVFMQTTWRLDTTGSKPCGYVICIKVMNRTIVSSGERDWYRYELPKGFCLHK